MKATKNRHIYSIPIAILLMMYLLPLQLQGRTTHYNLNIENGLPSNHVYSTITDRHGYLWIATPNGVVRYNGYSARLFDGLSGIKNPDAWSLFEDNKGRIWLSSISDELGYIYKDKYHKVYVDDLSYIYPVDFIDHPNGIAFISGDKHAITNLCIENNDSIRTVHLSNDISRFNTYALHHSGRLIIQKTNGSIYAVKMYGSKIDLRKIGTNSIKGLNLRGNYLLLKNNKKDNAYIDYINVPLEKRSHFKLKMDEVISIPHFYKQQYYFITNLGIYKLDSSLKIVETLTLDSLQNRAPGGSAEYISIADDDLWGRRLTTTNKGALLQLPESNLAHAINLPPGQYVGSSTDSFSYFWNGRSKILSSVNGIGSQQQTNHLPLPQRIKIIPYTPDTSLLIKENTVFKYTNGTVMPYFANFFWPNISDCLPDKTGALHSILGGFGYSVIQQINGQVVNKRMDNSRYNGIVYHPLYDFFMLYGNTHLLINKGGSLFKTSNEALGSIGKIEKIQVHAGYGYVFIKTNDRLLAYDLVQHKLKYLFEQYNLSNATIHLQQNKIIAGGKFGVVYTTVLPGMQFTAPKAYINFKGRNYNTVSNSFVVGNAYYLDTDKGIFTTPLTETAIQQSFEPQFKLIVRSLSQYGIIAMGDTLFLTQEENNPQFDFINPYGTGKVKYSYTLNNGDVGSYVNAESINLPVLIPGKYYMLQLVVRDDIWKTKPYTIHLYVEPKWWQTDNGRNTIIALIVLGIIVVSTIAILSTRHLITQKYRKRQRYLELELKSIYAQLNPHFIFNSLNNIVYFIKKNKNQEAYKYLTAFANLLRFYIRSSREKWVNIKEEAENLNNYIMLQQSRFDHRFDYDIYIAPNIDTEQLHIPSLLLQPIVENAIQHGLFPKKENGYLSVSFDLPADDLLVVKIEDNGIGRNNANEQKKIYPGNKVSYGTNLVKDLITIFQNYELLDIDITYTDKTAPLSGTIVTITIKYNHERIQLHNSR